MVRPGEPGYKTVAWMRPPLGAVAGSVAACRRIRRSSQKGNEDMESGQ